MKEGEEGEILELRLCVRERRNEFSFEERKKEIGGRGKVGIKV